MPDFHVQIICILNSKLPFKTFRRLVETHHLTEKLFVEVNTHLDGHTRFAFLHALHIEVDRVHEVGTARPCDLKCQPATRRMLRDALPQKPVTIATVAKVGFQILQPNVRCCCWTSVLRASISRCRKPDVEAVFAAVMCLFRKAPAPSFPRSNRRPRRGPRRLACVMPDLHSRPRWGRSRPAFHLP